MKRLGLAGLAILGLLPAGGLAAAAHVIGRDSVALPATNLQPGKPLAAQTATGPAKLAATAAVRRHDGRGGVATVPAHDRGRPDDAAAITARTGGDDDGTPDQGRGDAPATRLAGDDDGTADRGRGDRPGTRTTGDDRGPRTNDDEPRPASDDRTTSTATTAAPPPAATTTSEAGDDDSGSGRGSDDGRSGSGHGGGDDDSSGHGGGDDDSSGHGGDDD